MNEEQKAELRALTKEARGVLEPMTVVCTNRDWKAHDQFGDCETCHDSLRIPDPKVAGLLAVFREDCPKGNHYHWMNMRPKGTELQPCPRCGLVGNGTGYVLRDWTEAVDGALEGALVAGLVKAGNHVLITESAWYLSTQAAIGKILSMLWSPGDWQGEPRIAALKVTLAVLKARGGN